MKERALSEVIGFLMIVALLTILFSMYLIYVVPIQGRDAEISHMKYITQEFIGLKADIDGLIINNKVNLPIARSFELGTLSSVGSGSLSILPLSSFIEATGLLMVNEQNDFLAVTVNGSMMKVEDASKYPTVIEINCSSYDLCPEKPINYTVGDRFYNITTKPRYSLEPNNGNLSLPHVYLNMTNSTGVNSSVVFYYNISSYDLVLETRENSTVYPKPLISEKTLIENLSFGRYYAYNLLHDNALIPNNSTDYGMIEDEISTKYSINNITSKVGMFPPRVGSFQYESSNRYWVNQNLLFEMGGLFLNQPADGGSSVMLIPSIALTPVKDIDTDEWVLKVSVNNIRITDTEDISGSVSAQIFSKVDHINHNLFNGSESFSTYGSGPPIEQVNLWKLKEGARPNARAIWLQFIPDDPRVVNSTYWDPAGTLSPSDHERMKKTTELWKRGFDQIKTITNKTISDDPDKGEFSGWIYNFRIEDPTGTTNPPYSANMVIGANALTLKDKCDPITGAAEASDCQTAVQIYLGNATGREFILDYAESEVSLVMQSGAL